MTAKRFTVKQRQGATIYSIEDYYGELPLNEGIYYKSNADKLCEWLNIQHELLNTLYNENEQLKQELHKIKVVNEMLSMDFSNSEHELWRENEQLKFENNELKCALALDEVEYIIADGKKIDIPPYYEFEQRYDSVMHRREYDGYD